jgi:ribosomal-protein-alanine N-acetyltransferase
MVPIQTPRLLIRLLTPGDIPALITLWMDPEVTRHMGGPRDVSRLRQVYDEELQRLIPPRHTLWPVVERSTGRIIGECGLLEKEVGGRQELELVYIFARDVWGQGYASEAAAAVRDAALAAGTTRLIALIDPANPASAGVARKVGMQLHGDVIRPGGAVRQIYALETGQGNAAGTS